MVRWPPTLEYFVLTNLRWRQKLFCSFSWIFVGISIISGDQRWLFNSDWTWQSREKGLNKNSQIPLLLYLNTCMVFFNSTLVLDRLQRFWPIMGNWWTQTQLGENLNLRYTLHQTFFFIRTFGFNAWKSDTLTIKSWRCVENAKFWSFFCIKK